MPSSPRLQRSHSPVTSSFGVKRHHQQYYHLNYHFRILQYDQTVKVRTQDIPQLSRRRTKRKTIIADPPCKVCQCNSLNSMERTISCVRRSQHTASERGRPRLPKRNTQRGTIAIRRFMSRLLQSRCPLAVSLAIRWMSRNGKKQNLTSYKCALFDCSKFSSHRTFIIQHEVHRTLRRVGRRRSRLIRQRRPLIPLLIVPWTSNDRPIDHHTRQRVHPRARRPCERDMVNSWL